MKRKRNPIRNNTKTAGERTDTSKRNAAAFTRRELAGLLAAGFVLVLLALPLLANNKGRAQRLACLGNLEEIGTALLTWSADHDGRFPIQVDFFQGGTRNHPSGLSPNVWFQFAWLSNELVTPRILACPSDPEVMEAKDFSASPRHGFLSPLYRNAAVSYILGWPYAEDGRLVLSADRNIPVASYTSSTGIGPIAVLDPFAPSFGWLPAIHEEGGNLLFNDGSTEQVDDNGLHAALTNYPALGRSRPYFLYPRPPNF